MSKDNPRKEAFLICSEKTGVEFMFHRKESVAREMLKYAARLMEQDFGLYHRTGKCIGIWGPKYDADKTPQEIQKLIKEFRHG